MVGQVYANEEISRQISKGRPGGDASLVVDACMNTMTTYRILFTCPRSSESTPSHLHISLFPRKSRPRRIQHSPPTSNEFRALIPLDLLPLLRLGPHDSDTLILLLVLVRDTFKQRMGLEMLHHPTMQVFDVRDRVHDPAGSQHVRVLGVQSRGDDSRLVFARFEMRVGKTQEDLGELGSVEEVRQEFHRVGSQARYVLVGGRVLAAQGSDPFLYVFGYLGADFKSFV